MGSIYKSTSHFYFCFVIKKRIKKHRLILHSEELRYDIDLGGDVITIGGPLTNDTYPNMWQVNLGGQERLVLDADGDMWVTGRLHSIGTVIWNQELNRLEFWDGNVWQHLVTSDIV